jgi:hypothetical protein
LEEDAGAGGDFPGAGGDLDEAGLRIGEVEKDFLRSRARADRADAAADEIPLVAIGDSGLGFEEGEEGLEGLVGGEVIVAVVELMEEPMAEGAGAEGKDIEAAGRGDGEAGEGLAVGGGKEKGVAYEVGEGGGRELGFRHKILLIPI